MIIKYIFFSKTHHNFNIELIGDKDFMGQNPLISNPSICVGRYGFKKVCACFNSFKSNLV